ncbi:MAG TPA: conjugal transfer protein TraL [Nitrosospira sp.]
MANIHMVLQGKGGVGKSVVAALLTQYMVKKGDEPLCIDTDPVNATFHNYKGLKVRHLEVMEGNEINPRKFDELIESISNTDKPVVIDNGASSFVPLAHYLITNDIPVMLQEMGHELVIHTVITGGQALLDTVNGFSALITQFPDEARFVVWLNPYWGVIAHDGKGFEGFKAYRDNAGRISAVVRIPELMEQTFGRDFSDMLQKKLTFEEALKLPALSIMTRQRLKMIRDKLFNQFDELALA